MGQPAGGSFGARGSAGRECWRQNENVRQMMTGGAAAAGAKVAHTGRDCRRRTGRARVVAFHLQRVESVVLEARSREYCQERVRAGVLEQGTVDLFTEMGVGERMHRQGLVHRGIKLRFCGRTHRIDFDDLACGRRIMIYPQGDVIRDLVDARLAAGGQVIFEADAVGVHDLDSSRPKIHFQQDGESHELECDFIAGCDGFHGVCRPSIPAGR